MKLNSLEYQRAIQDVLAVMTGLQQELDGQACGMEKAGFEISALRMRFGIDLVAHLEVMIRKQLLPEAVSQADGEA